MRWLHIGILFAWGLAVEAQQSTFSGVTMDGTLTWTNETTNTYCGIEWTVNLQDGWIPFGGEGWQIRSTSSVVSFSIPLWGQFGIDELADSLSAIWPGYAARRQGHFFRIRSSSSMLLPTAITNVVAITNASGTELHNITVYENPEIGSTITITNIPTLAPSQATDDQVIVAQHPWLGWLDWSDIVRPNVTSYPGWFITWEQDGVDRTCGTTLVPLGSSESVHRVTVTIHSNRVETYYEWLGPGGTIPY